MTRIAPTLTLLAVAALGGGMFVANAVNDPAATQGAVPAPAAAAAPAPAGPNVIDLAQLPVAGAPAGESTAAPSAAPRPRTELSLAEIPVAGAPASAPAAAPAGGAPGRTEISLAEVPVAGAGAPAAPPAGEPSAYAGRTNDGALSVALAVRGDKATGYVCQRGRIEAWLSGTATAGKLELTSKSGRTVLSGAVGPNGVDGTVTIDGVESAYTAPATDVATAARNGRPDVGQVVERLGAV